MKRESTHAEELKLRLMTIELLRAAKKHYTYRELSSKTDLPVTVLSRYAKGHVLPNTERARRLWKILRKLVGLETELSRKIQFNKDGYFDNTEIVGDFNILRQILTAAVDGIPLATMVADSLGVNLVIAKRSKEVGVPAFLEETYVLSNSGVTMTLYVPKNALKRRDSVLIVDDMIKTGETQAALINLSQKARAEVSGIYSLISIGDDWQKRINLPKGCPVEVVTKVRAK